MKSQLIKISPSNVYRDVGLGFGNTNEYKYSLDDYFNDFIKKIYYHTNTIKQRQYIIKKLKKINKLNIIENDNTKINDIIENEPIIKKNKKVKKSLKKINIKSTTIKKSVDAVILNKNITDNIKTLHKEVEKKIIKINSNKSIDLKDKKEQLKKLDNVKKNINEVDKLTKKKVWCSNGINNEKPARDKFMLNNPTYKLELSNEPNHYKYLDNIFIFCGINDGIITTEDNKKYILEIKNVNSIKQKIPLSHGIQILIYTKMFNIDNIIYLQQTDDKNDIKYYDNYGMTNNNKRLWNTIVKRLTDYSNLINLCLSNEDVLNNILNNSYNELVNYLEWLF